MLYSSYYRKNGAVYSLNYYSNRSNIQMEDFWEQLYHSSSNSFMFYQKGKQVVCLRENILEVTMTKEQVGKGRNLFSDLKYVREKIRLVYSKFFSER